MSVALEQQTDGNLVVGAMRTLQVAETLKATELVLPVDLPFDEYESLVIALGHLNRATRWWIGDAVIYGEASYGEMQSQVAEATGLNPETVRNYRWVCERVPPSRRLEGVPFSVHAEVATLTPKEQRRWLSIARREGLSQRDLRFRIREEAELLDGSASNGEAAEPLGSSGGPSGRNRESDGANGQVQTEDIIQIVGTTPSGLPNAYVVPGAVVRRLKQLSVPGRDGYMRVPRDLYERLIAVLDD